MTRSFLGRLESVKRRVRDALLAPLVASRHIREGVYASLAGRGHRVVVESDGVLFVVDPRDRAVGATLIAEGAYQKATFEHALRALPQQAGRVFVDVGANIGTQTLYALRSGAFDRAVCIEPMADNLHLFALSLRLNGLEGRAQCVEAAAGAAPGKATLTLHPRNFAAHSLAVTPTRDAHETRTVRVTTVDAVMAEAGIASEEAGLVWMDVEGFEPQALAGMQRLLAARVPLVVEVAPDRYAPADRAAMNALLAEHYTHFRRVGEGGLGPVEPIATFAHLATFTDVLVT